jgi:glycosyltransferase involved in cell wall biosynthesis
VAETTESSDDAKDDQMRATIGLPFYNNERTLADAIRSVFAQSFEDWELILVDDGSHDQSPAIAKTVDDPRVRIVSDSTNRGLPARLNQIVELAQADYIVRMDADDMMHPRRLEKQVSFLDRHPDIDVVGSAMYSMDAQCNVHGIRGVGPVQPTPRSALERGILIHVTVAARRKWFAEFPYNVSLRRAQDRDLWCRTCTASKFATLPCPLMYVREATDQNTIHNYLRGCRSDRALFRKYGPAYLGKLGTYRMIGKSHVKATIHRLAYAVGFHQALIRRRNTPIPRQEWEHATRLLKEIHSRSAPGLVEP